MSPQDTKSADQDKAARLKRAAAQARALAAAKKAKAAAETEGKNKDKDKDTTAPVEVTDSAASVASAVSSTTEADADKKAKAARLARAAAQAKALAAAKKAQADKAQAESSSDDTAVEHATKDAAKSDANTDKSPEMAAKATTAPDKAEAKQSATAATQGKAPPKTASATATATATATSAAKKKINDQSSAHSDASAKTAGSNKVFGHMLFSGFMLALITAVCTVGILFTQHDTAPFIERNREAQEQALIASLLPEISAREQARGGKLSFECKLLSHPLIGKNLRAYVVRNDRQEIVGYISSYSTSRGYSNPLILIGGLDTNGRISKIDVQLSKETPGIGDKVERRRGNFLDQFDGQSIFSRNWDVKKFGGDFDYITGATVTSRALVLATKDFLEVMAETDVTTLPSCQ